MLLLPSERDLSPATIGLRLFSRDAAMRAGKPYAIIAGETPASVFPWWAWITIGGVIVGLAYLAIRRREGRDQPTYVLVDRSPESVAAESETVALHPFSDDAALSAAFDRDVALVWSGQDPWQKP